MKCFNHTDQEAIGICAKCGRGICEQCVGTTAARLVCKECFLQVKPSSHILNLNVVGALLGWLGAADLIMLEFWLVFTYISLAGLPAEALVYQIYMVGTITVVSAIMLILGSYFIMKNHPKKGGIINLTVVMAMALTYTYFAFLSKPQLLNWLGITGYLLLAPALISGLTVVTLKE